MFIIAYTVSLSLVNLILLNMFVAIIGSHYFEYYADNSGTQDKGLPELIINRYFATEIKNMNEGKLRSDLESSKSCCSKFYKNFKYWIIKNMLYSRLNINIGNS